MMSSDDRLTRLEELAAFQEKTVDALSTVVADQQKQIEELEKQVRFLGERVMLLSSSHEARGVIEKPPHY